MMGISLNGNVKEAQISEAALAWGPAIVIH